MRSERDALGQIRVLSERAYGAETTRAIKNFEGAPPGFLLGEFPALVRALVRIKQGAARANHETGFLDRSRMERIVSACDHVLEWNDYRSDFPIHILHGGGGTSANMNVNEVIAHVANRGADGKYRARGPVDPHDHVNKNQSTNDVYPSACRLSLYHDADLLHRSLQKGSDVLAGLEERHELTPRLARTCLRDAVKSEFGLFFGAYRRAWDRAGERIGGSLPRLLTLSVGGGVAGQRDATPARYRDAVLLELRRVFDCDGIQLTSDFTDAAQNSDDLLDLAHALDTLARVLIKQAQDLRLLGSGPEAGLGEVILPALQPGSSAIPGKINPVIPEFVIQCAMQTIASVTACGLAVQQAELDLNVWEGVLVYNLSIGLGLMRSAVDGFTDRCLSGLQIDEALNRKHSCVTTPKVAMLAQAISHHAALSDKLGLPGNTAP